MHHFKKEKINIKGCFDIDLRTNIRYNCLRLYDEKRKLIKENDIIEFTNRSTNEKIRTKVLKLHLYPAFDELYKGFDNVSLGYEENDIKNPSDMEIYYSKEEQCKYGVVGIEIKLI